MSGVTDCYQPIERKLRITRRCLEVLAEFRNPVAIITKNHLVTRDVDLLSELARHNAVVVNISVTTLDPALTPRLEPRASLPMHRLVAIEQLERKPVVLAGAGRRRNGVAEDVHVRSGGDEVLELVDIVFTSSD